MTHGIMVGRLLVETDDTRDDGIDYAVIEITAEVVDAIKDWYDSFLADLDIYPDTAEHTFRAHPATFYTSVVEVSFGGGPTPHAVWLDPSVTLGLPTRTEDDRLIISATGVSWSCTPKGDDITVTTIEVPYAAFEEADT